MTVKPTLQQVLMLPAEEVFPDPSQPRQAFDKDGLERMAASVAARGIIQPIRVRWDEQRGCWVIITGECRWRAARQAGLELVPCISVEGEPEEVDLLADQIIENTVRNSLRPLELARALGKLKALKKCTSQHLAAELGISGAAISRAESLLSLPEDVQAMVDDGRVPESAAYEISRMPDAQAQIELSRTVAAGRMNRDQVADAVRSRVGKRAVTPRAGRLTCKLDAGVSVTVSAGRPLTRTDLQAAIDRIRQESKKLPEYGDDGSAFRSP